MIRVEADCVRIIVPVSFRRRGGRRIIIAPEGVKPEKSTLRPDETLIHGVAKARRWQVMYEQGKFASLEAFAEKFHLNKSYAARVMRLNLLAPDIREAILDGRQPRGLKLAEMMKPFPAEWHLQRDAFGFAQPDSLSRRPVSKEA